MTGAHLTWSQLEERIIEATAPFAMRLDGPVVMHLFYEPDARRLGLRVPKGEEDLGPSPLALVSIGAHRVGDTDVVEIATAAEALFPYFHAFALSVADRVQLDGLDTHAAVNECIVRWQDLLRAAGRLGPERELGLLGELWLLRHLVRQRGASEALASWTGPTRAAHDFRFEGQEIEVKTTRGERRVHQISSETQLVASEGCALSILSLQFTLAGPAEGLTLADAITELRAALGHGAALHDFDGLLGAAFDLDPTDLAAYATRVKLRTPPYLVPVTEDFPRLLPARALPPAQLARVSDVRYRVDVDGLGYLPGTDPFTTVLGALDP